MGDSYGTGIEIWAGFGPVGITKKNWADYEHFLRAFFSCFHGKKKCIIRTKKLHKMKFNF